MNKGPFETFFTKIGPGAPLHFPDSRFPRGLSD